MLSSVEVGCDEVKSINQINIEKYLEGLVSNTDNKSCTAMAEKLGISHDVLYRQLCNAKKNKIIIANELLQMVDQFATKENPGNVILDDSCIAKLFAKAMEGIFRARSGVLNRTVMSYTIVVICWTNGKITIPIAFKFWKSKKLCKEDEYKKKTELAEDLMKYVDKKIDFEYFLADALYASQKIMNLCDHLNRRFEMRFPVNRLVSLCPVKTRKEKKEKCFQVRHHPKIRLKKNQKSATFIVYVKNVRRFLTLEKKQISPGEYKIVYIISNHKTPPKKAIGIYAIRWHVEKMFRTMKQKLGIGRCQARSKNNQAAHILSVFLAYAYLQKLQFQQKMNSPEKALRYYQQLKPDAPCMSITFLGQCYMAIA